MRLPTRIKDDEATPFGKRIMPIHLADRIGGVPCIGYSAAPNVVLAFAIEPDDRRCEHLMYGGQRPLVGPPFLHSSRINRICAIVVAERSDRMVVPSRPIIVEQICQAEALYHASKLSVECRIATVNGRYWCGQGRIPKSSSFDIVHIKALDDQVCQTMKRILFLCTIWIRERKRE